MSEEEKNLQEEQLVSELEPISEPAVDPAQEDIATLKAASEAERKRTYKTGSKVAAFIFFFITLAVFIVCEYCATVFLYAPLVSGVHDFGEAIAAIFGYTFGLIVAIIFGIAQLPENIISIILFKRLRGKSDKKWENRLFTAMFIISIVLLAIMLLTFALFFIVIGSNKN